MSIIKSLKSFIEHLKSTPQSVKKDNLVEKEPSAQHYSEVDRSGKTIQIACKSSSLQPLLDLLRPEIQCPYRNGYYYVHLNEILCMTVEVKNVTTYATKEHSWSLQIILMIEPVMRTAAGAWLEVFILGLKTAHQDLISNGKVDKLVLMTSCYKDYDYEYVITLNQESWD